MAIDVDTLLRGLDRGGWLPLSPPGQTQPMVPESLLPEGDGVLVASGGSSGGRQVCLQPWSHLDQSAAATASWLRGIGLEPSETLLLNPLPLHHVSGLMPWWRSRCWGAWHQMLSKDLMKDPAALLQISRSWSFWRDDRPFLISLVPTQLARLMAHPDGVKWLKSFAVIWMGGAALPQSLAEQARVHGVRLAPCYGATETAAMVAALSPEAFLGGESGCGRPLSDVQLRLAEDGSLMVRTERLAVARWSPDHQEALNKLTDSQGWWRSGDAAVLGQNLTILGRRDGAILSGGETVFPEQLEARLIRAMTATGLSEVPVLFLAEKNDEWGERLVALVGSENIAVVSALERLTEPWSPAESPKRWLSCPTLRRSELGKWQRAEWRRWLQSQRPV